MPWELDTLFGVREVAGVMWFSRVCRPSSAMPKKAKAWGEAVGEDKSDEDKRVGWRFGRQALEVGA